MFEKVKDYLRKVLIFGCRLKEGDSLVVVLPDDSILVKECLEKLKEELGLKNLYYVERNMEKLYHFLERDPSVEEMLSFIPRVDVKEDEHTKCLLFWDETRFEYESALLFNYQSVYELYDRLAKQVNPLLYRYYQADNMTISVCGFQKWANLISSGDSSTLWDNIIKTVPTEQEIRENIKQIEEKVRYLNSFRAPTLHFSTELGTDFRIGLSDYSLWLASSLESAKLMPNFPSYEMYTCPDNRTLEGKVVLSRPSVLRGVCKVEQAELKFEKGKLQKISSDSDFWEGIILDDENKLNQVGEIALVLKDSPIERLHWHSENLLLDENSGCHLALGDGLKECTTLLNPDEDTLEKHHFSTSFFHQDLVFGTDDVNVEIEEGGRQKVLIEKGKWVAS